jgi:hypothetical protein
MIEAPARISKLKLSIINSKRMVSEGNKQESVNTIKNDIEHIPSRTPFGTEVNLTKDLISEFENHRQNVEQIDTDVSSDKLYQMLENMMENLNNIEEALDEENEFQI